jgi:cyanophycinase
MKKTFVYTFLNLLLLNFNLGFTQPHTVATPKPITVANSVIGPAKGSLVIVGGGAINNEIWGKYLELAGGANAHIVVIPTASEDSSATGERTVKRLKELGVKNITVLHTRDPKVANQEQFVAPLKKATGVWFDGGRQWRLADAYLNTRTHKELQAVLERGGVIGGTSAGATILGSFMVRGDTKGNTIMIGDHVEGLGFLKNVTIDQHVLRRNRQFDLLNVIKKHPELLGLGIDEGTAVVVQQNTFQVLGNSYVAIYDADQITGKSTKSPSGEYGTNGQFFFLGNGQRFDLQSRKVIQ